MDWLEQELREALRRQEPSPDFMQRPKRAQVFPLRRWLAAAAAMLVTIGAAGALREYEGQQAKRQVLLAVHIAGAKMSRIQAQVRGVSQ